MATKKYTLGADGYYTAMVWDGTYTATGKKHRKEIRSKKSSKDLELKVQEYKIALENKAVTVPSFITLHDYAERWLKVDKASLRPNTKEKYAYHIKKFEKVNVRISELKRDHWTLITEGETIPVIHECYKVFRQVVRAAITDRLLPKSAEEDILKMITLPTYIVKPKRALTPAEKEAVLHVKLWPKDKAFLYIIYGCGLRREEALALTVDDFRDGKVYINKVLTYIKSKPLLEEDLAKSSNAVRAVPVPSFAQRFLDKYLLTKKKYLFCNQDGSVLALSNYRNMWVRIQKAIDEYVGYETGLTAHIFRHNYCSTLCYQVPKVSIKTIAKLLGDSEKMVLEVYNHIMSEQEDQIGAIESGLKVTKKAAT